MIWNSLFARGTLLAVLSMFMFLPATELDGQVVQGRDFRSGMNTGIGYAGILPDAPIGAGIFHLFGSSGFGVFGDWKMTQRSLEGHRDFCPEELDECTIEWVQRERNDFIIRSQQEWQVLNGGLVYAIAPEIALYAGGGLAHRTEFVEYFEEYDPELGEVPELITLSGAYYVKDEEASGWNPTMTFGTFIRAGRSLVFRLGYETEPGGMSLGVFWVLP